MPYAIRSAASADDSPSGTTSSCCPGFEEEFADLLEKEDGALGGFRHEFYLWLSLGAFMAAGSVTERKDSDPEYEPQPLLAAGCKGTFAIDRRQRPTPGVGATNGDILPV